MIIHMYTGFGGEHRKFNSWIVGGMHYRCSIRIQGKSNKLEVSNDQWWQ